LEERGNTTLSIQIIRSAKSLNPEQRAALNAILAKVGQNFGDPHKHGGLGLRKVGADLWECRLDLRLRVVFSLETKGLGAYDIMKSGTTPPSTPTPTRPFRCSSLNSQIHFLVLP
jgi:hypothetical protein